MKINKTLISDNTTPLSQSPFLGMLVNQQERMADKQEEIKKYKGFRYVVPDTEHKDKWGIGKGGE